MLGAVQTAAMDVAERQVVFEEPTWKETWEPMMRADFKLFDEFGAPKPIGERDGGERWMGRVGVEWESFCLVVRLFLFW